MQSLSTRTNLLLLTAFAMGAAFYVIDTNFVLSCILLGLEIVFGFLAILSRGPKEQRRVKLILMSVVCAIAIMIFILY